MLAVASFAKAVALFGALILFLGGGLIALSFGATMLVTLFSGGLQKSKQLGVAAGILSQREGLGLALRLLWGAAFLTAFLGGVMVASGLAGKTGAEWLACANSCHAAGYRNGATEQRGVRHACLCDGKELYERDN